MGEGYTQKNNKARSISLQMIKKCQTNGQEPSSRLGKMMCGAPGSPIRL
jgi:hypothetical protein